jgi:hypothetical protein
MKTLFFAILFFSLISPVFVHAETCPLSGDNPPCGVISLAEVIAGINQWASGNASLSDVIGLITAWSGPQDLVFNKPVVELFVMSYCPYGLQIEKGLIPVLDTLNDSINFSVKFCGYAMHGRIEINEQLTQYCIQREQMSRYLPYLRCFLVDGNTSGCLNLTGIDHAELAECTESADYEYNITQSYYNQTAWFAGRYPPFGIYKEETEQYNIYSSPTLLVNGTIVDTTRDPKSLLETVCASFAARPAACDANLSDETPAPGFGFIDTGNNQTGSC